MKRQEKFSRLLKQCRKVKQYCFRALGKLLKVSSTILVHYERGISYPTSKILERLCGVFGWDFKSTYLLIQNEKSPEKTLARHFQVIKPQYPELRSILLDRYDPKIYNIDKKEASRNSVKRVLHTYVHNFAKNPRLHFADRAEVEKELEKYPYHFVEARLLADAYRYTFKQDPPEGTKVFEFYQGLGLVDRETKINNAIDLWSYDITAQTMLICMNTTGEKGGPLKKFGVLKLKLDLIFEQTVPNE